MRSARTTRRSWHRCDAQAHGRASLAEAGGWRLVAGGLVGWASKQRQFQGRPRGASEQLRGRGLGYGNLIVTRATQDEECLAGGALCVVAREGVNAPRTHGHLERAFVQ